MGSFGDATTFTGSSFTGATAAFAACARLAPVCVAMCADGVASAAFAAAARCDPDCVAAGDVVACFTAITAAFARFAPVCVDTGGGAGFGGSAGRAGAGLGASF